MSEHDIVAMTKVTNIDTDHWSPSQVARWLSQVTDEGRVARVAVVVEYEDDGKPGVILERMFSKCKRQELLYLATWFYRNTVARYFG